MAINGKKIMLGVLSGLLALIVVLTIAVVILFARLATQSREGSPPGLADGRLARCPESPNCICSEYPDDARHYIGPVAVPAGASGDVIVTVGRLITEMGGMVVTSDGGYMAATFGSSLFGFVDDFEVRFDAALEVVQVRSASRVGYGDLGVNADRVGRFNARLADLFATD